MSLAALALLTTLAIKVIAPELEYYEKLNKISSDISNTNTTWYPTTKQFKESFAEATRKFFAGTVSDIYFHSLPIRKSVN